MPGDVSLARLIRDHGRAIVLSETDPDTLAAHIRDAEAAHRRPAWEA